MLIWLIFIRKKFDLLFIFIAGVVKALLPCYDSCRFAHLSVTQCISDEMKYGNNFAEMKDSFDKDPEALIMVYDLFKYFAKSLAKFVHLALIKAIKKVRNQL